MTFSFRQWLRQLGQQGRVGKKRSKDVRDKSPRLERQALLLEALEAREAPAVRVWDGGGAGALWSTAANWSNDIAPAAGDDLVFPTGALQTANSNNLAAGTRFNTILIQAGGYAITGNAIELVGGLTANNVTGTNTFGLDTTLINAQSIIDANPGTQLNLTGAIHTGNIIGNYYLGTVPALVFDGAGTVNITGVIDGAGSIGKLGSGTAILGGNNTFEGIADARQGFLRVTHANGLGSATAGHTEVQAGAALELSGAATAENIVIREGGVGFGNGTDPSSLGALRAVGGSSSSVFNVELIGGNNLIGAAASSTLVVNGVILSGISNTNRLIKVGPGTLQLAGSNDNVYRGETRVLQGTLELNKTGGKNAIGGDLIIGDNIGGDNAATVKLLQSNQIPQVDFFGVAIPAITLNSSGLLNLNGNSDTIGNLILTTGTTYSADVATGTGTLTLGGNLTLNNFQGSSGATPAATIAGNLDLGAFFSGGAAGTGAGGTRTFSIADTAHTNVAADLDISANISGTSGVSITKTGAGTLRLGGANTFSGPFIMNGGVVDVNSNTAFGTALVSLQNSGNILRATGTSRAIANTISLDGDIFFLGDDSVAGSENLTLSGNVTLTAGRTIFTPDATQTVTFSGSIGEGIFGSLVLNKSGRGTVVFTGANTYSGTTTINNDGGTLALRNGGSILNVSAITVGTGATLNIDNSGTTSADRINDATTVNVSGRLLFTGNVAADTKEFVGTINPNTDVSSIIEINNTSSGSFEAVLVGNAMAVGNNRPTRFVGTGLALSETGKSRLAFTNNPAGLSNGILQQGVVTGPASAVDFATYGSAPEGIAIVPLPAGAYVTDIAQASTTSNVRLSSNTAMPANRNINALLIDPGVTLSGAANAALTVNNTTIFAGNGTLSVANFNQGSTGLISVLGSGTATISSVIYANATLRKQGTGKLILTGDNQYAGQTQVNEGVLNIQRSTALGSPAGDTVVRTPGSLEIEQTSFGAVVIGLETITVEGFGGAANVGGLRNIAGNNSIAGTVNFSSNTGASNDVLLKFGGWMGSNSVNNSFAYADIASGSQLTITGAIGGNADLVKLGVGTLEVSGVLTNNNRTSRVYEGTVLLNREPGLAGSSGSFGTPVIGSDAIGAPTATLKLGGSDQIRDDNNIFVLSSGLLDFNGFNDRVQAIDLAINSVNAGDIALGSGTMVINGQVTVQTLGTGNASGSTITGGTLALQMFGTIAGNGSRTFLVNDGASGTDLTITSTVVDGTGLQGVGISKTGFGALALGGTGANTNTGDTTVTEGTLLLNKGSGSGGVNAFAGRLFIGSTDGNNQSVTSGFASSDVVRLLQPNQIPDYLALIDIANTGLLDLNGMNETIGVADVQNALTLRPGATVELGGATLTINGNINMNAAQVVNLWTPVVGTRILNGTLNLGSITRTIDVPDRGELPYELEISANLTGSGGFIMNNGGTILLSGNNNGLSGDVIRTNGNFAIGSDTAFGTGRVLANDGTHFTTYGGKRTVANAFLFSNNTRFIGGNNTAGSGAIGGGGNDLTFTGPVTLAAGNWFPTVAIAGQVEFAGGLGETYGSAFVRKQGFGTMIISSAATFSGDMVIGQDPGTSYGRTRANGGHVVLTGNGTVLNSSIEVGYGGVLEIDNSGIVNTNRIADSARIDLSGGVLALTGKSGVAVSEVFGQLRPLNNSSANYVQSLVPNTVGSSATWRFASFAPETVNVGDTVKFVGRGTDISASGTNKIGFIAAPVLTNSIVTYAVLQGTAGGLDFVTVTNLNPAVAPADNFVTALTSGPNFATTLVGATATVNVKLSAAETALTGPITANALLLPASGRDVTVAGALTLNSGLLVATGASNTVSATNLTMGAAEGILFSDTGTLTLSANITAGATSVLASAGLGTVIVSGTNSFVGSTRVTSGVFRASSNTAFGTTAGNVIVIYGSSLELNGVNVPAEQLNIAGLGETNLAAVGLRAVAGTSSTWNGVVSIDHNRSAIEVGAGGTLNLAGAVNNQGINKTGPGTLQFSGGTANGFAGGALFIWQGIVQLNKTAGTNAFNTNVTVGDNVGGANADQLILLAADQIPNANNVTVTSTGRFDIGANNETINNFSLQTGLVASGTITGAAGVLTINADSTIDVMANSNGGGSAGSATIAGNLAFGGGTRILTVNDTVAVEDVVVSAVFANGNNFTKQGAGRGVLSGNSSAYTNVITVNGGELAVRNAGALGTTAGNTVVNNGFSLLIENVSTAEPLNINGVGFGGEGAVRAISGSTVWSGGITLAGTSTIGVDNGAMLDESGVVSGNQQLNKLLPGVLRFSGASANTNNGITNVFEGTLELNKTAGVNAIAGTLTIGNDAGAQDSDLVKLIQANQIADTVQLQVTPSGRFDLNGQNETIGQAAQTGLNLFVGITTFPNITTGAGTLTLASGLGVQTNTPGGLATFVTSSPGATITGNLALGGNTIFNAQDSGLNIRELQIDATITGTAGFQRSGAGIMVVTSANAGLSGGITLNSGGGLVVTNNGLGSGAITIPTNITTSLFATNYTAGAPVTQTISNAISLNNNAATATTLGLRGDDNLILSGTITNTLNNNVITANMQQDASVTLSGTINLSNDGTPRTLTVNNNTFGGGVNNTLLGGMVAITGQVVNGGAGAGAFTKGGVGLAVLSNNTNSFTGVTTVAGGILQVTTNGALGANGTINTNQTTVNNGATLAVNAGLVLPEWLVLNNNGVGNFGSVRFLDASVGVTETATISGNVNFNTTAFVGVDGGGANPDRLIFTGVLNSGGGLTTKVGLGEAEFGGTADNVAFTGGPSAFDDGIEIRAGTLYFSKTGTNRVILGTVAVNVGDNGGGDNADRLILIGSGTNQIDDALTVNVLSSGQMTWGGASTTETIANLTLSTGLSVSGDVDSNSRILTVGTNVTVNTFGATTGTAPAAQIGGNLVVNGSFAINDTFIPSANDDLIVTATFFYTYPAPSGGFYPGLKEGRITGNAFDTTTPNPGTNVQLFPRAGETTTSPPWADNTTWVYTGEIFDADGIFSFAENIDDNVQIRIDGLERLNNTTWNVPTTTGSVTNNAAPGGNVTTNFGPGVGGWHTIEIRMGNGGGGAGPVAATGWTSTFGLGFSSTGSITTDGANYVIPLDNGTQNLFRTPQAGILPGLPDFAKSGLGTLNLKSPSVPYNTATINGGTLTVSGSTTLGTLATLNVNAGASFVVDNSGTIVADRIANGAAINLTGGTISYVGNSAAATSETVGAISLTASNGFINAIQSTTSGTGTNSLTSASLTRNAGATVSFVGVGTDIGSASNQLQFTGGTNPYVNSVIPYATVTGPAGFDLVTDGDGTPASAPFVINRVTTYATNINTANGIVKLDGTELAANRVLSGPTTIAGLLLANGVTVSGANTLTVGTSGAGQIVSSSGTNLIAVGGLNFAGLDQLYQIQTGSSLEVSSPITGTAALRKERSGTLTLSGNNAGFTGATIVSQGALSAKNSGAFGTTAGGVNVVTGATLILDGNLAIGNEQLDLTGSTTLIPSLVVDTLRAVNGNTTWGTNTTAINYNNNNVNNNVFINTVGASILTFNGTIAANTNLFKYGSGDLVYRGTADNNNNGGVSVNEGRLVLDKRTANVIAIRNATITVDDLGNFDPVGAGTLLYAATGLSNNELEDGSNVTVNHQGIVDFNGKAETITGTLTVNGGTFQNTAGGGAFQVNALSISGGSVNTGSGFLILNGNATYTSGLATGGAATINGNVNLNNAQRVIDVRDGYFSNNDLTINAAFVNGRIRKDGAGALLLSNAGSVFLADANEVQTLTVPATVTTFTLSLNAFGANLTTVSIPFSTSTPAASIQAALELLPNIQPGNVSVTGVAGGPYTVTFQGELQGIDFGQLTSTAVGGTITHGTTTNGASSVQHNGGLLAVSNNAALGTQRVQVTANPSTFIAAGGPITIANSVTVFPSINLILGGRRDFTGNSALTFSGPISLATAATAQDINFQVDDTLTNVTISGAIGGGNSTGFLRVQKTGIGTLTLAGANTFLSPVNIAAGVLKLQNNDALGARVNERQFVQDTGAPFTLTFNGFTTTSIPTGSTTTVVAAALNALASIGGSNASVVVTGTGVVNATTFNPFVIEFQGFLSGTDVVAMTAAGATILAVTSNGGGTTITSGGELQLSGSLAIGNESLSANGQGFLNRSSLESLFVGALHSTAGASTWGNGTTPIAIGNPTYFGTDSGTSINLNGTITGGSELRKVGVGGTVTLSGSLANTYTGQTAVYSGTLVLNKTPGLNASTAGFIAGDNVGAANSDVIILAAAEQINDGQAVTVAGSGQVQTNAAQAISLTNEVQQVFVGNAGPSGQFRLNFNGVSTGDLAFGSTAAQIQAALNALSTIGGVGGSVYVAGGPANQNTAFTVTFLGSLAGANQPQLKIVSGTTPYAGATLAVTTLTQGGLAGRETIGAPTLRMAPQATGNILLNAGSTLSLNGDLTVDNYGALSASAPTTATIFGGTLELQRQSAAGGPATRNFNVTADGPGADDLIVTSIITDGSRASMSNLVKNTGAASRMVLTAANTFSGTTVANVGALQIENVGSLGATLPSEIQNYVTTNALGAATGQYFLTFNAVNTANLDPAATADEVAAALNAISTIGGVGGSVQVVSVVNGNTNIQYFIRFGGTLAGTDVAQITTNTGTLGGGATVGGAATSQGGGLANIAASQTTVNNNGALELDISGTNTITNEQLALNNTGIINAAVSGIFNNGVQTFTGTGALRNLTGNNTWNGTVSGQGNVSIANNPTTIGVNLGTTLTIGSTTGLNILSGGGSLLKYGAGTLELGGTLANTYSGNTYVNEGTLRLNKQGAVRAIPGGEIMIGDNVGADNADVLEYAATAGTDQIGDRTTRISRTGLLDLNGKSDTINNQFFLDVGPASSADLTTGAGILTNTNGTPYTVVNQAGLLAASPAALISGFINLQAAAGGQATHTILVREGLADEELNISAVIDDGDGNANLQSITKTGRGNLVLSNTNTYTGLTIVGADSGTLTVAANGALGGVVAPPPIAVAIASQTAATFIGDGSSLAFKGSINYTALESIVVVGGGKDGLGVIQNISGTNTFAGPLSISPGLLYGSTDAILNSLAGSLTLSGTVALQNARLVVNGAGDTIISGVLSGNTNTTATANGFDERLYDTSPGAAPVQSNTAAVLGNLGAVRKLLGTNLNFPSDNSFVIETGYNIDLDGAFSAAWLTTFTPDENGIWQFQVTGAIDDDASVWLDFNQDGAYDISERLAFRGCCGALAAFNTQSLVSGQKYQLAFMFGDTGGGGTFPGAQVRRPSSGSFLNLDPSLVALNGVFTVPDNDSIVKNDSGKLTISNANTFSNGVTVNGGILSVTNATGSGTGTGAVAVNTTATLIGTGIIGGPLAINSGGTVNPGTVGTTGVLTVTNNVAFNPGSVLNVDLNGTTAGTQYDQLAVTGAASTVTIASGALIGGTLGYTPTNGNRLLVINKAAGVTISGTFDSQLPVVLPQTSPATVNIGGKTFNTDYNTVTAPNNGFSLVLEAVPATRVWDGGDVGSNNWNLAPNWVGDNINDKPFPGDDLVFNDTGVLARPNPSNDYVATSFNSITLSNTIGAYNLGGLGATIAGSVIANQGFGITNTLSMPITGASTLVQSGAGTLIVASANTFTGATSITNGTLLVNGTLANTVSVAVATGGTLAGTGTINALSTTTAASGSFVTPGNPGSATGTLNTGSVNLAAGSTTTLQINGTGLGEADQINVSGGVILGGTLVLSVGYTPGSSDEFIIVNNDGGDDVVGIFSGMPAGTVVGGGFFKIFYTGGDGNDVVLKPATVPVAYVDNDWALYTLFQIIPDANPETGVAEQGIFGYNAFASINVGLANVSSGGILYVNDGAYGEAVNAAGSVNINLLGTGPFPAPSTITVNSLTGVAAANLNLGIVNANNFIVGDATNTTFAGPVAGLGNLTKISTGTLTLSNSTSSFTGPINVTGGLLATPDVANSGVNSPLGSGSTITLNGGGLQFTGAGADSTNRPITLGASGGIIDVSNAAGNLSLANNLGQGGAGNFTKTGLGTVTLPQTSSYTGTTNINGGTVAVSSGDSIPNGALLTVGSAGTLSLLAGETIGTTNLTSGTTSGAQVTLGTNTLTLSATVSLVVSGTGAFGAVISGAGGSAVNLSGARTFDAANGLANYDLDIAASIVNGSVVKTGTGTVAFSGAAGNTYAGNTNVNDGTLALNKSGIANNALVGPGVVIIGDGLGLDNTATLRIDASEQILNTLDISFGGLDGQLFAAVGTETIKPLPVNFNGGDVRVAGTLITTGDYQQTAGVGTTTMVSGGTLQVGSTGIGNFILSSGKLQGAGTILTTQLQNRTGGTIDPGIGNTTQVGTLTILGNLYQGNPTIAVGAAREASAGVIHIDVGGAGITDRIAVGFNPGITIPAPADSVGYYTSNGTALFRGALEIGRLSDQATPTNLTTFDNAMTFQYRRLDEILTNHSRLPSDFATKTTTADVDGFRYDPRFLDTANNLNGQSVWSSTTGFLSEPSPAITLYNARKLTLTALNAPVIVQPVSTTNGLAGSGLIFLSRGVNITNTGLQHLRHIVTVVNNTLAPITGPVYLEVSDPVKTGTSIPVTGVKLFNSAGKTLSASKEYVVVSTGATAWAVGTPLSVELDWFNPKVGLSSPNFTYTTRVLTGGLP